MRVKGREAVLRPQAKKKKGEAHQQRAVHLYKRGYSKRLLRVGRSLKRRGCPPLLSLCEGVLQEAQRQGAHHVGPRQVAASHRGSGTVQEALPSAAHPCHVRAASLAARPSH